MSVRINFIQRKSFRERAWKTLSVVVGITTILNVSMVGALIAPQAANATGGTPPLYCPSGNPLYMWDRTPNASWSHGQISGYYEGEDIPVQLVLDGLTANNPTTIKVQHQYIRNGVVGIERLEHVDAPIEPSITYNPDRLAFTMGSPVISGSNPSLKTYTLSFTPSGSTASLYFDALLGPDAHLYNGASLHVSLPDCGSKDVPIAVNQILYHDLQISKTDSVDPIQLQSTTTYTIVAKNNGKTDGGEQNFTVTDTLPAGMSYVVGSAVPNPTAVVGQVISWNLGTVADGATKTITFSATGVAVGTHRNNAVLTTTGGGPVSDYEDTTVLGSCALAIDKYIKQGTEWVKTATTANPSDTLTYKIIYQNTGTANCTGGGVRIDDSIPANTTYVNGSNTQSVTGDTDGQSIHFGYSDAKFGASNPTGFDGSKLSWNGHVVSPNETGTITFQVTVNEQRLCVKTTIENTAKISADQFPNGIWSNGNTAVTTTVTTPCQGSISGQKYNDLNGNGTKDQGEPGLPDWTIRLLNTSDVQLATTTTDANGNYSFTNLTPNTTYRVREVGQANWTQTSTNPSDVVLGDNQDVTGIDFGNFQRGKIDGYKFNDLDGDGTWDQNEPALANWGINMDGPGANDSNVVTNGSGYFSFWTPVPGSYSISETQQPDWTQTAPDPHTAVIAATSGMHEVVNFGNHRNGVTITFDKVIVGGGPAVDSNFVFAVDGQGAYLDGQTASLDTNTVHDVTESSTLSDLYTLTDASGACALNKDGQIVLTVGEQNATCVVENTRNVGSLTVNKMVDLKGDGNFTSVSGDATPFRWQLNGGSDQLMGSTLSNLPTGSNYNVTENDIEHFDFVGWYYTDQDYSCARPQFNGWPTDLTVNKDADTSITLCNARDYKDPVTLNAWKIVCTDEADLPNWGATGGPNITATTAQDWVSSHKSCSLKNDWYFQYAPDLSWPGNPGDNTGAAGAPWTTFGPTDANGFASATIADFDGITLLWVREAWQNGYIPFTMGPNYDNSNDVSAEMYCHTDVINYDNFEWINNLQAGQTYNCVAWNVENQGTVTVTKELDRDGNGTFETTNPKDWVWELDQQTGLAMGDTVTTVMGPHTVKESGPSNDYHFVGWYYTNTDSSCTDEKLNTSYPINIDVAVNQNVAVTLCNARDTGTIDGYKWEDSNGNGVWDNGEPALANFRIQTLHGQYGVTDGNGYYHIDNVATGIESLVELAWNGSAWVSPDLLGWDMTYPTNVSGFAALDLVITYGQTTHQNFGNYQLGQIHGFKYDNHQNKLDGWTICLVPWNDDALSLTNGDSNCVLTGEGEWPLGYYEFTGLGAGTYRVYEIMKDGWTNVTPTQQIVTITSGDNTSVDFINRQIFPDLSVTKTDDATTRQPGDLVTYELVVKNEGEYPAYNAQAVDTLPPYMTYQSSTVDGSPASPNQVGATLTWFLGTMNPGDTRTILVTVKYDTVFPAGTTNLNNCVEVSLGSEEVVREVQTINVGEQNTENNIACDNNTVDAAPTINIVKTGPATVTAGQNIVYTLAWSVGGNAPASNAIVSDTVPSNSSFVSSSCGTTVGACGMSALNDTISWDLGTRQPGESGTVTMTVKAAAPIANGTQVKNTACFDTTENDKVCDDETTTIESAPSLSITKSNDVIGFTNPGKTVTYTVTVTNAAGATDTAHNVGLTDVLPAGFTYTIGGGTTKSFALGEIAPGVSVVTTYSALISAQQTAGLYTNTASAKGDNTTTVVATSTVDVRVPSVLAVTSEPTLTLTKSVDATTTNPGKTITYTVTISNPGDVDVTGVSLTDTLPKGFVFVDTGKATKTWDLGTLKAHHQRVLNYLVKINDSVKAGEYINKAVLLSAELDPIEAQAKVTVKVPQVLGLATTGVSARDYIVFALGALLLAIGVGLTVRLGRRTHGATA